MKEQKGRYSSGGGRWEVFVETLEAFCCILGMGDAMMDCLPTHVDFFRVEFHFFYCAMFSRGVWNLLLDCVPVHFTCHAPIKQLQESDMLF